MDVKYVETISRGGEEFYIIFTPHFQERQSEGYTIEVNLEKLFDTMDEDKVYGVVQPNSILYANRKYNWKRDRWELELITITQKRPECQSRGPQGVYTYNRKYAIPISYEEML